MRFILPFFVLVVCAADDAPARQAGPDAARSASLKSPKVVIDARLGFIITPCVKAGCRGGWQDVKLKRGRFHFAGLRMALGVLRKRYQRQRGLTLVPGRGVSWGTVMKTIATVRDKADGRRMFPVVFFATSTR